MSDDEVKVSVEGDDVEVHARSASGRVEMVANFDFSDFHPLTHNVVHCFGYPGGRRRHLSFAWEFRTGHKVHRWTTCLIGRHRRVDVNFRRGDGWVKQERCLYCLKAVGPEVEGSPPPPWVKVQ